MPFPWKKAKATRFSRLLADLQTLPKRRESLVVETGFPTSLVDLFVKNQDRLKKPSKKKRNKSPGNIPRSVLNPPDTNHSPDHVISTPPPCQNSQIADVGIVSGDLGKAEFVVGDDMIKSEGRVLGANAVFLGVLKMFLVLILAPVTKKLAVGITMSACLLLLLEFLGKYLFCFRSPCSAVRMRLKSMIKRGLILIWRKNDVLEGKGIGSEENTLVSTTCGGLVMVLEAGSTIEENEIIECNCDDVDEIQIEEPTFNVLNRGKVVGSIEENLEDNVIGKDEDRCEFSRLQKGSRGKLRETMIKRLVPKKLRSSEKGKRRKDTEQELSNELFCYLKGYTIVKSKEREQKDGEHQDTEDEEKSMSSSLEEKEKSGKHDGIDVAISSVEGKLLQANAEIASDREEVERLTKGKSRYLILLLIVLAGLLGGRILALVLTLAGSLVLKSAGNLRGFNNEAIDG